MTFLHVANSVLLFARNLTLVRFLCPFTAFFHVFQRLVPPSEENLKTLHMLSFFSELLF